MRRLAADARVDLVEHHRLAAPDRGDRERDPRELAARRGLGDGAERQARVRADQEDGLVSAGLAWIALAQLDPELALAHADAAELLGHRFREWTCCCLARLAQRVRELARPGLGRRERLGRCCGGVEPLVERRQLRAGGLGTGEQLVVVGGAEPAACVRDLLQLALDVLEPVGLGLERREEAAQVRAHLAQPQLEVAQLLACARELRREPLDRCERVLGCGGEPGRSLALLGRKRLGCARRSLGELGDVAQPLALVAERLLASGLEPVRRLDEGAELAQPRLLGRRATGQLVVPLASGSELAPGEARLAAAAQLVLAGEGVEHVELVRRPTEAALLELAGHRDQPLRGRGEILARDGAPPGVGAGATVAEDAAGEHEAGLVLGRELGEACELLVLEEAVGEVELSLDVGLGSARPDDAGIALRAEQETDGLGQNRLAGARLARDRRQSGAGHELAVADEDEVLDPQATKQRSGGSG